MPALGSDPALVTDPGTDPHTAATTTRTSPTFPWGIEEAPLRSPAWRQGAASTAHLIGVATTEATVEAGPAALAEEARTEAALGRGGKINPPGPNRFRMPRKR
jgi:hypothetical protein